jgi:hypothetical protein
VQFAKDLSKIIAAARRDSWNHFTTGDGSWFDLPTDNEIISLEEEEDRLRRCLNRKENILTETMLK